MTPPAARLSFLALTHSPGQADPVVRSLLATNVVGCTVPVQQAPVLGCRTHHTHEGCCVHWFMQSASDVEDKDDRALQGPAWSNPLRMVQALALPARPQGTGDRFLLERKMPWVALRPMLAASSSWARCIKHKASQGGQYGKA